MITDEQLHVFANLLGATIFLLVVAYHYVVPQFTPEKTDQFSGKNGREYPERA